MNELKFIKNFKTFVDEINKSNSRNYKLATLEKYKNNDCIKYFLQQIYDPYLIFGISDKKLNKNVGHQSGTIWLDYPEDSVIFDYLKTHNTGTDIDIWTVQQYKDSQICDDCKELFDKIVTKNLQLGISTKSINDIFGKDTIKEFKVQLAEKFFDQKENFLEGKKFAITTKIDGMRCIMLKENGEVKFFSRQGQPIEGLVDLEEEAKYFPDNVCLDGELVAISDNPDTYKQTMRLARQTTNLEKHSLKMIVFDCMDATDFRAQLCERPYHSRNTDLFYLFTNANHEFQYFQKLPILYQGTDISKIIELLDEQTSKGEEGVMINIFDAPYEFKRTNQLLKVKKFQDCDLKVIGYQEGTNKNANRLGALICDYKGNELYVGGGYSDEDRDEIWTHRDEWIGKVITVKYFEETQNANGGLSLRFPTFVGERLNIDKNTPDY